MIEVEMTEEVVYVNIEEPVINDDGLILLRTGYNTDTGSELIQMQDKEEWVEIEAESMAQVRGTGIATFSVRERVLQAGSYKVRSQYRRGSSDRLFLMNLSKIDDTIIIKVEKGSAPATWIIGSHDPIRTKDGDALLILVNNGFESVEHQRAQ